MHCASNTSQHDLTLCISRHLPDRFVFQTGLVPYYTVMLSLHKCCVIVGIVTCIILSWIYIYIDGTPSEKINIARLFKANMNERKKFMDKRKTNN